MKKIPARLVEWKDIARWCSAIGEKVVESGFRPDAVIGLARGGWIPARLVSDELGVKQLISIRTQHWGVTASKDGKATLATTIQESVEDRKLLIVDDITDTGDSIKLAFEHASSLSPAAVRTATMLHINHSGFVPDYFAEEVDANHWTWYVFPWNYGEDMATFIGNILSEGPRSLKDVSTALKEYNNITIDERKLLSTLIRFSKLGIVFKKGSLWEKR